MTILGSRISRRNALLVTGGAVAAAGVIAATPFRVVMERRARELIATRSFGRRMLSLANGSYEEWMAQVGSVFAVGGGVAMRLAGVQALASTGSRPMSVSRARAFVAMFDPVGRATMASDLIYTANHPEYGPLQIFLSASTNVRTPARMLAVFN